MTRSIGLSQRNTWNFFQNFSSYHSPETTLSEFFSAKNFVVTQNKFPPGWSGWKVSFSSLKLRSKSQILAIFAFSACCVQHCSHSGASALVQLASLESSYLFYVGGSTRKSLWDPGGTIQEHLLQLWQNTFGHSRQYTYPPPKQFFLVF